MSANAARLALGTAQIGLVYGVANQNGQVSLDEARGIVQRARAAGVDTIDTAIAYGESEQTLGACGVGGMRVVTKLPPMPKNCSDVDGWVEESLTSSLRRLRVERLHSLLLHRPQDLESPQGDALYRALTRAREAGLASKIGYSIYDPVELTTLMKKYPADVIQAPLNVLDRRLVDSGWAERLRESGVELHVRSAFLQGLLLMSPTRPAKFAKWDALWRAWDAWLTASGLTALAACLHYVLAQPVDRVVVGVDSAAQLEAILAVCDQVVGAAPPLSLATTDTQLINPANWSQLL